MTPEAQRIAIAQACGWRHVCVTRLDFKDRFWGISPTNKDIVPEKTDNVPDYPNDLNAMHEATVAVIHPNMHTRRKYYQTLYAITGDLWNTIDATAAQRAEAFLRTLNLYTT